MKKTILVILLLFAAAANMMAIRHECIRWGDETTDTLRINAILAEAAPIRDDGKRSAFIARKFVDTPYVAHTLEAPDSVGELLTIDLQRLDCTTFVETVAALSLTAGQRRTSWRDFVYNLEQIRYRHGHLDGYTSRLHYISDWVIDNSHRGFFTEVTNRFDRHSYIERSICFMSENARRYPALADSSNLARIVEIERGFAGHRFPYIKAIDLGRKEILSRLNDGDIIALVTNLKNLDVTHMAMIVVDDDGVRHLIHASSRAGRVIVDNRPIAEIFRKDRSLVGIRVIRLKND